MSARPRRERGASRSLRARCGRACSSATRTPVPRTPCSLRTPRSLRTPCNPHVPQLSHGLEPAALQPPHPAASARTGVSLAAHGGRIGWP
eukprot:2684802-Prymnesium_polylepis.1